MSRFYLVRLFCCGVLSVVSEDLDGYRGARDSPLRWMGLTRLRLKWREGGMVVVLKIWNQTGTVVCWLAQELEMADCPVTHTLRQPHQS